MSRATPHDASRTVQVLLPYALPGPLSYVVPRGLEVGPGDYVRVPLGPRDTIGVVWDNAPDDIGFDPEKLREISDRYETPPMPATHRRFIDWVANYTLYPAGQVLRMCLRVPEALGPERTRTGYRLAGPEPERMTAQRARVIAAAADGAIWMPGELAREAGVSDAVVRGLVDAGTLVPETFAALARFAPPDLSPGPAKLSREQRAAADALRAAIAARDFSVTLVDGVTGSGKTEVYLEAVAAAVAAGRQVLVLLPEIALTGHFIARVGERFRADPAEWHSGVRARERERVWRAVASGEARIVVGARSALFLPYRNPGLIVVDEEHDEAFKQEEGVAYHARDMAVAYGAIGRFPVVLSSATPSLETIYNVEHGRYRRVVLPDRHNAAPLPEIVPVDLRRHPPARGTWLSEPLRQAVGETLEAGGQALLFLNRRGYAPLTLCRACGHRFQCPNCDTWLVEHRFRRQLQCHLGGPIARGPDRGPTGGAEGTRVACGPGIERVADEARELWPEARMVLLSSDLTRGASLRDTLAEIASRTYDLIVGTQLVAKGHHFPGLSLVGVVDADIGLANADLRAAERTFQLLTQVSGRAGRGDEPGRALVQTYAPGHPLIRALVNHDRDGFYAAESRQREQAGLPPFGRLAGLVISAARREEAEEFARELARRIPPADSVVVLGPAPAPIAVIRGRHRFRFLVKARRDVDIQAYCRAWLADARPRGSVRMSIDIDPYSFL